MVYEHAGLTKPESEQVCIYARWTSSGAHARAIFGSKVDEEESKFGIAFTCKQIAAETLPLLYSSKFVFNTLTEVDLFLDAIGESCKYLRHMLVIQPDAGPETLRQGRQICERLASSAPNLTELTIVPGFQLVARGSWLVGDEC